MSDYSIVLDFDVDKHQLINFKPFLIKSRHPDIRRWLDVDKFSVFPLNMANWFGEIMNCVSLFMIYIVMS
jgi:hypothetical protein